MSNSVTQLNGNRDERKPVIVEEKKEKKQDASVNDLTQ